jgi:hypothetical protein
MAVRKHPNSKFAVGSYAYEQRQKKLAQIRERIRRGESFSDLQGHDR